MSSRERGRAPAIVERPTRPEGTGAVLQAKCACGGSAGMFTGECEECQGKRLQRQAISGPSQDPAEVEADRVAEQVTAPAAAGLIVEDDAAAAGPGQMHKTEFLDALERASCDAADTAMASGGRSTEGCPYIERAFSRYRTITAAQVETGVRRYIDPEGVIAARDYIPRVSRRVGEGVTRWMETGDMSAVPPELAAEFTGGAGGMLGGFLGALGGGLAGIVGGIGRLLFKRAASGESTDDETVRAASQLDGGAPLDGSIRSRMEQAFGYDFSAVRIHTDSRAAAASSSLGARAFTIGSDIAFAGNEYRPNTPVGDALLAHELAHVVQQSGGVHAKGTAGDALDEEADRSAVGAVMNIWTGVKHVAANAVPRLRSGLRLQRCKSDEEKAEELAQTLVQPLHAALTGKGTDEAAVLKTLVSIGRDPIKSAALKKVYKKSFKTGLEADLKAKLSGETLSRALFLLNAPPAATEAHADVTVDKPGTEREKTKVAGGEVTVRTDVEYTLPDATKRTGGYSVGYEGAGSAETRVLQMLWAEIISTKADGSEDWLDKRGLRTSQEGTMDLTLKGGPPKYKVDTASTTSPFYEAGGVTIRTSTGTTIYDRPHEFTALIHEQFDAGATKVIERDHFDAFIIKENKPVYQVPIVVEWVYTSKTAVTRTVTPAAGTAIDALPGEVKKQLVKEYPSYEYIR